MSISLFPLHEHTLWCAEKQSFSLTKADPSQERCLRFFITYASRQDEFTLLVFLSDTDEFRRNAIKLSTEDLVGINLSNTDMRGANFWMVNFSHADMRGADLTGAYLRDTNFYRANLNDASLKDSRLTSAIFTLTCLDRTDYPRAELALTIFRYIDLSTAKGLETYISGQPYLNIETLLLSKGNIPDELLKHTHLPQTMIDYARSLTHNMSENIGSQAPLKLFYCYTREDERLRGHLERHLSLLKREGLVISWCYREITAGEYYEQKILSNIDTSDIFLVLVSPAFMNSDYCHNVELK